MRLLASLGLFTIAVMFKRSPILIVAFLCISMLCSCFSPSIPVTGQTNQGSTSETSSNHYSLSEFLPGIVNGNPGQVVGVYASDILALPVIQQPSGNPSFVSTMDETATQFSLADQYGSIGLVAHNTLAGKYFFSLKQGDELTLIYGDGSQQQFKISRIYQFQALSPSSPYSKFVDTENPDQTMSVETVFNLIYGIKDRLVLQTCIAKGNTDSWGRLFVVAEPMPLPDQAQSFQPTLQNRVVWQPQLAGGYLRILASM